MFEIECPRCSERFELLWANIRWPEGEPEKAHAVCPNGCVIEEGDEKRRAVEAGRWRVTAPHAKGHHGYRSNALISLLSAARWGALASEWTAAQHDSDRLRSFVTTILAEPWRDDVSSDIDEGELAARAEPIGLHRIPEAALILTAGADIQSDRIELVSTAWDKAGMLLRLGARDVVGSDRRERGLGRPR